jgi:hypothetical protein
MIRKFFCIIFALAFPFFVFASNEGLMDWEGVFSGFHQEFLKSLLFFFKIAWPYLVGLIIFKIVLNTIFKRIDKWKKDRNKKTK